MATCLDPRVSISHMYYINHPQGHCTILEVNAWRLVESHPRREMNTWAHGPREAMTVVAVGHQLHVPNTVLLPLGPTDLSTGARTNRSVSLDPQPMRMRGGGPMRCRQWKKQCNILSEGDTMRRGRGRDGGLTFSPCPSTSFQVRSKEARERIPASPHGLYVPTED